MEVAGVALGVAALFSTCVESFDIIVRSREFGNDFDLLCTQLSLVQIRLKVWGESLGLVPENGIAKPYTCNILLDHPDVRPSIERALFHLHRLLSEADVVTSRYDSEGEWQVEEPVSKGLTVFQKSFDLFKQRIRRNQKKMSTWKVTRWAIHDLEKFKALIANIKDLIEALEGITIPLGSLWQHQQLLAQEVSLVSETESLRLLVEVSSMPGSSWSLRVVCDSSSYRLTHFTTSAHSATSKTGNSGATSSYYTAPEQPLDDRSETRTLNQSMRVAAVQAEEFLLRALPESKESEQKQPPPSRRDVPQNQRIMRQMIQDRNFVAPEPSFASGDCRHGLSMTQIKSNDEMVWEEKGPRLLMKANNGGSVARRVFLELRSIKAAKIPFLSARALGDSMDKILASIEGPPDTPYEGGIFWLKVHYQTADISHPPVLRFITRVYHPNIDCLGNICADYQDWWGDAHLKGFMAKEHVNPSSASWFSTKSCLASILTAICGLLASPNVEDPLVPEIAETYVKDHERYCEIARAYTLNHAMDLELDEGDILSMDEADDIKAPFLGMADPVKHSDTDSAVCGSSVSSSCVSTRQKEKLLYDHEARSERRILARLGGGSSSGSSSSSDDFSERHVDDGTPDEHYRYIEEYLDALPCSSNTPSLPVPRTDSLKRRTSSEDLQGIFDPDWDNNAAQSSRRNRKHRRRRHRSSSRRSPTDGDEDFDMGDKGESHGKLVEGLIPMPSPPLESLQSSQAHTWSPFTQYALDLKVARVSAKVQDGETPSLSSDAGSTTKTILAWDCLKISEEEAREEMATMHSLNMASSHSSQSLQAGYIHDNSPFDEAHATAFWSGWQPEHGTLNNFSNGSFGVSQGYYQ